MSEPLRITLNGVSMEVVRRRIKTLYLTVYPPDGRVRVAAPLSLTDEEIKRFVTQKMEWITRHREKFQRYPPLARLEVVSGETHTLFGKPYLLKVINGEGRPKVELSGDFSMELSVPHGADADYRRKVLREWYRSQLHKLLPETARRWEGALGVRAGEWRVREMRTKWGSCNVKARRIWLNLALAKYPLEYLNYIAVHELNHLLEPSHNLRFKSLMDRALPDWRVVDKGMRRYPASI